jgi:general secretion pathway protein L
MLGEISSWWLRQMQDLVAAWRPARPAAPDAVIVALDDLRLEPSLAASGTILLRRDGHESVNRPLNFSRPLEAGALPNLPAGLRLPPGMVLRREVALPLAAERDLATVIDFEMDRLTPFASDEVFWSTSLVSRAPGPAGLRLNLLIVPSRPVELLAQAMGSLNLRPSFVESPAGRIDLTSWRKRPAERWRLALSGLCLALALACLVTPLVRQQLALQAAALQLAAQAPGRQEALALRQQLANAAAGAAVLAAASASGDVLASLAALTQALPDGTSLNDLSLQGSDLTIDGLSTNAAGLIAILAAAPGFRNPAFTAPVTRTIGGNADLFSIHATVTP